MSGGKALRISREWRTSCAGCGSEAVSAAKRKEGRRKHDDTTTNLRTNDVRQQRVLVRVIEDLADVGERQPGAQGHE